ncbi:unnamed protein product, partial [Lampetra fluviatilis]
MLRVAVATVADASVSMATGGVGAVELTGSLGGLGLGDLTGGVTGVGRSRGGPDGVAVVAVGNLEARPRRRRSAALSFTVERGLLHDAHAAVRVTRCRVRAGALLYRHPAASLRLLGRSLGETADALRDAMGAETPLRDLAGDTDEVEEKVETVKEDEEKVEVEEEEVLLVDVEVESPVVVLPRRNGRPCVPSPSGPPGPHGPAEPRRATGAVEGAGGVDVEVDVAASVVELGDPSPHGLLYPERLLTLGPDGVTLRLIKFGGVADRACDAQLMVRVGPLRFVHTQRYVVQALAFLHSFTQLQDALGRQRAALAGHAVRCEASRASRLQLDVQAGPAQLLLPEGHASPHLLHVSLGSLHATNRFARSSSSSSHKQQQPADDDDGGDGGDAGEGGGGDSEPDTPSRTRDTENGEPRDTEQAAAVATRRQWATLSGLLQGNLGEVLEEPPRPYTLQEPSTHTVLSGEVFSCLAFSLHMVDVTLDLVDASGEKLQSLARVELTRSRLEFESLSDGSRTLHLVSRSVSAHDTRPAPSSDDASSAGHPHPAFSTVLQAGVDRNRGDGDDDDLGGDLYGRVVATGGGRWGSEVVAGGRASGVGGTEFVFLENPQCDKSAAVVVRGTAVIAYKPHLLERPFSAILSGLEVVLSSLSVRLSYNDLRLFAGIVASLRAQADSASSGAGFHFEQSFSAQLEGSAQFTLMADYYNRQLSGWEPFVERWPARVHWFTEPANQMHPSRQIVKVTAKERLYVNITASLI